MNVLITGASSGFGREMARVFVKNGHQVIALARRQDRLVELQDELGPNLYPLAMDVCDSNAVSCLPEKLPEEMSAIDTLINNAGLALGAEPAQVCNLEDWMTMIDTNCRGLVQVTRALLPGMVKRNSGHVINLSSVAGKWPYKGGNVYGATKAFVSQFSLNLRTDLAETAVRVTDVAPGLCGGTEFSTVRYAGDQTRVDNLYKNVLPLSATDIAETVYWVSTRPAHVNINTIEMMPVAQTFGGLSVFKG